MAINSNTPLSVVAEATFNALPVADKDPLLTILENANGMYEAHAPALISALYTCEHLITGRSAVFWIPVLPSIDGLDYDFSHWVYGGAGVGAVTITVEEYIAGWGAIHASGALGLAAATWLRHNHTTAISASATILRVTISRAAGSEFSPSAILVRPGTNAPAVGVKASGFVPFDDGMLAVGTSDAGINTEHLNRGPQNAMAILRDRRQCVWSFVQEYSQTDAVYSTYTSPLSDTVPACFGQAVGLIPFAHDPVVTVYAIGVVDGGATTDLIDVYQVGKSGVKLDADGAVQSASLTLEMDASGTIEARAKIGADAACKAGQVTHIAAVIVLWRPGD
jgi:hypothetical protein